MSPGTPSINQRKTRTHQGKNKYEFQEPDFHIVLINFDDEISVFEVQLMGWIIQKPAKNITIMLRFKSCRIEI